jgi:hypothetical protein
MRYVSLISEGTASITSIDASSSDREYVFRNLLQTPSEGNAIIPREIVFAFHESGENTLTSGHLLTTSSQMLRWDQLKAMDELKSHLRLGGRV